jgi:septum site-determining protein MinD
VRSVVITSGKGGVGKSTLSMNLGSALATLGPKVVIIDADTGLRNMDTLMGVEQRVVFDLVDVASGRATVQKALIRSKVTPGLALLPTSQKHDKHAVSASSIQAVVDAIEEAADADFVLIDSPAGIEHGFQVAIAAAREAIVVANPEVSSIRDADRVIGLLNDSQNVERTLLVVNRVRQDMIDSGDMLTPKDVTEVLGLPVLGIVPNDDAVVVSSNQGVPLPPKSPTGRVMRNIALRLLGENVPVRTDLSPTRRGWWRLAR